MTGYSKAEYSTNISSEHVNYDDSGKADSQTDFEDESNIKLKSTSELEDDNLQSDDSDAPVGVSWKDSKEVVLQDERNRSDAVDFARSADKAKRRKKNEMFVSQKEAKRKYELTKLPDDIILAVAKKPETLVTDKSKKGSDKKLEKEKKSKKRKKSETDEYCHVIVLDEEVKKSKKVQESAADFLKNHLYGNRIQRTSVSKQLTMQCKSSGIMKPAVKFNTKV